MPTSDHFSSGSGPLTTLSATPDVAIPAELTSATPDLPGYRLSREIGRGGMGIVYEAEDVLLRRRVAVKLLQSSLRASGDRLGRLWDEAEAVARLNHPNVVRIHQVGEVPIGPFLVLEYLSGGTLAERVGKGPLAPTDAAILIATLARAVHHAHLRGVIHRDLKPGNVLFSEEGTPKVADFGLARFVGEDRKRTRTGAILGTAYYIAPELVTDGPRAASPSADIYALGAILYECVTGRPPISGSTLWDTLRKVAEVAPIPPTRLRPDVPRSLEAICLKCLEKEPGRRYATAAELATDLERAADGRTVRVRRPWVTDARHRISQAAVIASVLAAVALMATGGDSDGPSDAQAALLAGRALLAKQAFADAEAVYERGLRLTEHSPTAGGFQDELAGGYRQARQGRIASELRDLVDRLRLESVSAVRAQAHQAALSEAANRLWAARAAVLPPTGIVEGELRDDLSDMALLSADLLTRADGGTSESHLRAAVRIGEAESLLGSRVMLTHARQAHRATAEGQPTPPLPEVDAQFESWELLTLGRYHLLAERFDLAAACIDTATRRAGVNGFWTTFLRAECASRSGRYLEAIAGFSECLVAKPKCAARCAYSRGHAYAALENLEAAAADFDAALRGEPEFAAAALSRGAIRTRQRRFDEALDDFSLARKLGHRAGEVEYRTAIALQAAGRLTAAADSASRVTPSDPEYALARLLIRRIGEFPQTAQGEIGGAR